MSLIRTGMLLAALTALFMVVGYLIGGSTGMLLALVFAAVTNGFAWWNSDRMVLSMHGAQPVTRMAQPELHDMVARLASQAGLPMPKLYLINQRQPNAFATGRNPQNGAVAVTLGLLRLLDREEVEGVIAHELAHIRNRDTLTMTIAATVAGAISMLAQFGFFLGGNRERGQFGIVGMLIAVFLAPLAAALIQMSLSRVREYAADREGAEISGNPMGLARALARIHEGVTRIPMGSAEANPHSGPLFILNPLKGVAFDRLFATHPPVASRIAALEAMAADGSYRMPERRIPGLRRSSVPSVRRR